MSQRVRGSSRGARRVGVLILGASGLVAACGGGAPALPPVRPLVIHSGVRVFPDAERMREVDEWLRGELENIREDPSFLIVTVPRETPAYPWESLLIEGDTARIGVYRGAPEARTPFMVYAHLRLMKRMGRLEEWLPEAAGAEGYELERAILDRVAEVWLFGRSVFNAEPYAPLEELVYARAHGYLDAFLLTARGDEFPEERAAWLREDPDGMETYRSWFVATFEREPPGLRDREESRRR